ncbi:MAG: aminotransferase class I/II-fold pyridoxal phosphate-dependent enzyme [Ruminococcaceae bacterium]|nr:aminotransferase class I/II-fold pyridoxal phosphate-dependent enzyme [Oscillospiraceae bacterium]
MNYLNQSIEALIKEKTACIAQLEKLTEKGLSLDLSRGKPSKLQLEISMEMLDTLNHTSDFIAENGQDCRNYGGIDGIPEAKRMLADMMDTAPDHVLVGGNSSLTLMYQIISHAMIHGICGSKPWSQVENRKFLCPVPGYDRHFTMVDHFGFELIPVPMLEDGPDMDMVQALVENDESIKGIWCVPKYQNPTGIVFSDEVVKRFAALTPKAEDFRIFWDNAYCVHAFEGENADLLDIIGACEEAGNPDMVYEFCSTSKITFPGSGISAVACSNANLADIKGFLKFATIGPDKMNQLMHARYFQNGKGIRCHMKKHAAVMAPKFTAAYRVLEEMLGDCGIAHWTYAKGGYFFSYVTLQGCATRIVSMCREYGVKFTPAGATHPYGVDPSDCHIRIAPSFAGMEEITMAVGVLALCTKIVSIEKVLESGNYVVA